MEDQAMVRNATSSILGYLTSPIPLVRFDMPVKGKSMMQAIMYDIEKDKVVFFECRILYRQSRNEKNY
ncbi:MAG TPA: hypothetical protein VGE24_03185 [Emticicia sp.]